MRDVTDHPEAVWFGGEGARSFGMLHRPARPTGCGVVICNTLGFEGLLAHRPFRHLAEALVAQGCTVLRLDYAGTGDAFGELAQPVDIEGLLASIDDGVELLRGQQRCTAISLVGIRIGATLACRYAVEHPVENLVLWAPFDRGSLYVRELKALNRLSNASRPAQRIAPPDARRAGTTAPATPPALEVVGFQFTLDLLEQLGDIDLVAELDRPPSRRVLLLERDEMAPNVDLDAALRASGAATEHRQVRGWTGFMVADETQSEMPVEALDAITTWMGADPHRQPGAAATIDVRGRNGGPRPAHREVRDHGADIIERSVWIDRLFGLITEPGAGTRSRRALIVMANTGSVNRSGPGRLYVHLARRWAALGFTVIRVDLGGTGDSAAPAGTAENLPYSPTRTTELLATVAWARANLDVDDVTLFGICSGAFHSFHAAVESRDVDHIILVNPSILYLGADDTVQSSNGKAIMAAHSLHRFGSIRNLVVSGLRSPCELFRFSRRAGRGIAYLWVARARRLLTRIGLSVRERDDLGQDLDRLAELGTDTLAVFAAAEPGVRYLRTFGGATLTRLTAQGAVRVIEIDGGDHVFSPPCARAALADAVTRHLETVRPADDAEQTSLENRTSV